MTKCSNGERKFPQKTWKQASESCGVSRETAAASVGATSEERSSSAALKLEQKVLLRASELLLIKVISHLIWTLCC